MDINSAIIESASEAGIKPIELAVAVGVTLPAAQKWFSRKASPTGETLLKLLNVPKFGDCLGRKLRVKTLRAKAVA